MVLPVENAETGLSVRGKINEIASFVNEAIAAGTVPIVEVVGKVYTNRATAVATNIPLAVNRIGVKAVTGQTLYYRSDLAGTALSTNSGTLNWSPDTPNGAAYPDHFAENTVPGTTNMTAAINAAVLNGPAVNVELLSSIYMINDTIVIRGKQLSNALEQIRFVGQGKNSSEIRQTDHTKDTLNIKKHADGASVFGWATGEVGNFSIRANGATKAQKGAAIRHNRCLQVKFHDIIIQGPTDIMVSEGSAMCLYQNLYSRGTFRAAGQGMDRVYTFTENGTNRSFGNFMSNCEHQAGEMADATFDIQAVDGLYVSNCHFNDSYKKVWIRPNNTEWQRTVYQLMFTNCYFDGDGDPTDSVHVEATNPGGTTPLVRIEGVSFTGCFFRVGSRGVFRLDQTDAGIAGLMSLKAVHFTGCHYKQFRGRLFTVAHPTMADPVSIINGFEVNGGTIEDGPWSPPNANNLNAFSLSGKNLKVHGVTFTGDWTDAGEAPITIAQKSENVSIRDNVFDVPRTANNIVRNVLAVNVSIVGNIHRSRPNQYIIGTSVYVEGDGDTPGIVISPRQSLVASDLATSANAVFGGETSVSHTVATGGFHRWMTGATSPLTGTAGATERARVDALGLSVVGRASVNGVAFGAAEITIADDAVGLVNLPEGRFGAIAIIHCQGTVSDVLNSNSGMVRIDAGSSPAIVSIQGGANFATSTATLTGTTGTDTFTTVSPNNARQLQIENRSAASRTYQVVFL